MGLFSIDDTIESSSLELSSPNLNADTSSDPPNLNVDTCGDPALATYDMSA